MGFPGGTVDLPGPARPELADIVAAALLDPYGHGERLGAALRGEVPVARRPPGHQRLGVRRRRRRGCCWCGTASSAGSTPAVTSTSASSRPTAPPASWPRRRVWPRWSPIGAPALVRATVFPAGRAGRPTGTGTSTTSSWPTRAPPSRPRRTRRWRGSRSTPCPRTGSPTWTSSWPCWSARAARHGSAVVRGARCRSSQRDPRPRADRVSPIAPYRPAIAGGPTPPRRGAARWCGRRCRPAAPNARRARCG